MGFLCLTKDTSCTDLLSCNKNEMTVNVASQPYSKNQQLNIDPIIWNATEMFILKLNLVNCPK